MSETVHYKGKLRIVDKLPNEGLEEQCKRLLKADEITKYYSSYQEMFEDTLHDTYVISDENIYEVVKKNRIEYDDSIFILNENTDGTYDYEVMYYNGGCGFTEAIAYSFKNLKQKQI